MALRLYNTITRRIEPFLPLAPPRVTIYTCGPTVWTYAHLGNFRTFLNQDLLRRYLEYLGYDVFQIMNLTDVDDRIIAEARKAGKTISEHTQPFAEAFFQDRDYLGMQPAHVYPRATGAVESMVRLVQDLLDRGVAYRAEDQSVYFAVEKFEGYGRLSQLDKRELKVGARVESDEYSKENLRDFALWKASTPADEAVGAAWDAPFGRGRPGWHLECSAMALEELRSRFGIATLDIHAGGVDLIFPHHENEIAQSEAVTGQPFSRVWMHGEFLTVEGTKMSKRYGNFLTVRDLREEGVDPAAVRMLFFQTHYRKQFNFSDASLAAAGKGAERIGELHQRLLATVGGTLGGEPGEAGALLERDVGRALDEDLNAPNALAAVSNFVTTANRALDGGEWSPAEAAGNLQILGRVTEVFGILPRRPAEDPELARWVEGKIAERQKARSAGDFSSSDAIRDELAAAGIVLEDTPQGARWKQRGS
ncbi:MAG: cysteine--tRNA ligase [Gemmatimonadetes bacterium]|nr:cysteine--tRNA ligase [Gemmatimonadota bacterium]